MILKSIFSTATILLFGVISSAQEDKASLIKKVEGFSHPESVVIDELNNYMYVSNMADDAPGDGFISRLAEDGSIETREWITGLKDPKGLLVKGDKLYVTNNTEIIEMDIAKGEISKTIKVESAKSLNDITIDDNGDLYISDSGKSAIYKMDTDSGQVTEWLDSKDLEYVNGLLFGNQKLYASAWGSDNKPGNFLMINPDDKSIHKISSKGIGNLDGVQKIDNETFYISDWGTGKIYRINTDGKKEEIISSDKSSGDILFLEKKNELVLPMNFQNEIWWYKIN
ncbi:SMP-30/gluconolactonase/LRE family protein [Salegentibacter sp. F188]|uniref:SMP-30/gluconolactonase/LRE family protein n=1 Tax=Autumnicola patrickiae TaxID=3075591 RepID=A0ABU3E4E0_9FLAO|nr:SMP-30/gluconolactonase/LRE family protein [Salegentibacter sp. F188]MDT0690117.1 SMP-30/gluconolactonase/LRE family protein [Salegentibacter sp. F188]